MNISDQTDLAEQLKRLKPGFLPYDIFVQVARLSVLPIIELVPVRRGQDSSIEVLLLERPEDDRIWPGMVHSPGTVLRPTDAEVGLDAAFNRIITDELNGTKVSAPRFVDTYFHKSRRGAEFAQVYWAEVLEEPSVGKMYELSKLPENLIESQHVFIKDAAANYQNNLN